MNNWSSNTATETASPTSVSTPENTGDKAALPRHDVHAIRESVRKGAGYEPNKQGYITGHDPMSPFYQGTVADLLLLLDSASSASIQALRQFWLTRSSIGTSAVGFGHFPEADDEVWHRPAGTVRGVPVSRLGRDDRPVSEVFRSASLWDWDE